MDEKGDTPSQTSIFYGEDGGGPDFISRKLIKGWDELITDIDSEENKRLSDNNVFLIKISPKY